MAKWIKVGENDYVRETDIKRVTVQTTGIVEVVVSDGTTYTAHSQDETTSDFIKLFKGLDIGDQA